MNGVHSRHKLLKSKHDIANVILHEGTFEHFSCLKICLRTDITVKLLKGLHPGNQVIKKPQTEI